MHNGQEAFVFDGRRSKFCRDGVNRWIATDERLYHSTDSGVRWSPRDLLPRRKGKVLITGASEGLGKELARLLMTRGHDVPGRAD